MFEKCCTDELEALINATPDGGICELENKIYYIERPIIIKNRSNITVNGNGAVICGHYNNGNSDKETTDHMHIIGCNGITLNNLVFDTDNLINIVGTVTEIDAENDSYVFKVDDSIKITGKEILMTQNSCDNTGFCDFRLEYYCRHSNPEIITMLAGEILLAATYVGCKNDYLGNNVFRIYLPEGYSKKLFAGQRICIRHSSYGPVCLLVKNSDNTVLTDVKIISAGGMGVVILPHSTNFTAERLCIKSERKMQLMSGNCDGIHITGLAGNLVLKDCEFDGLGDDALNIHSTAATVSNSDISAGTLKCNYCKKSPDGLLSPDWCREGDIISVLDSVSVKQIGSFRVKSFNGDTLKYCDLSGTVKKGDILQNTKFNARTEVSGCIITRMRARGCVFQTENITIKNCEFNSIPLAAVHAAPDIKKWYEVGPVKNMSILGNKFYMCTAAYGAEHRPVIGFADNHDSICAGKGQIHNNILIADNVFEKINGRCIYASCVSGLDIRDNVYTDCIEGGFKKIEIVNSENVAVSDKA